MKNNYIKIWLPVVIWMLFIFTLSGIPNLKTNLQEDNLLRKLAHITEYFILIALLFRAFQVSFKSNLKNTYFYPILITIQYSLLDEYHQTFVQGRHGCFADVIIDSMGILIFCASKIII